jgi:hypothetical protein
MYRIGSFVVPVASREEFLPSVETAHAMLQTQEGYVTGFILERASQDPNVVHIMSVVEWASAEALERVSAEVAKAYRDRGYDRGEILRRLGIKAEDEVYRRIAS